MAKRIPYNPHFVTRSERLAFRFKDDQVRVLDLTAKRRFRNSALLPHELILRFHQVVGDRDRRQRFTTPQYVANERIVTVAEV